MWYTPEYMRLASTSNRHTAIVREVCRNHPVSLAYLFGSHARGTADAESDLDVAILTAPNLTKEERHALRFRLMRSLADALEIPLEKIDLVVLQDVPNLLQYNVIRNGVPVFVKAESARLDYELQVERRYEDEASFLERESQLTVDRILAHRS